MIKWVIASRRRDRKNASVMFWWPKKNEWVHGPVNELKTWRSGAAARREILTHPILKMQSAPGRSWETKVIRLCDVDKFKIETTILMGVPGE